MQTYVMDADRRLREIALLEDRLTRWRRHPAKAHVVQVYDRLLPKATRRLRIVEKRSLLRTRATVWRIEQRRFGLWRTQFPYGSSLCSPDHTSLADAEWFFDLCVRVDVRTLAFDRLMIETSYEHRHRKTLRSRWSAFTRAAA